VQLIHRDIVELKKTLDAKTRVANEKISSFEKQKELFNSETNKDLLQINTIFDQIHQQIEAKKESIRKSYLLYSVERENYVTAKTNVANEYLQKLNTLSSQLALFNQQLENANYQQLSDQISSQKLQNLGSAFNAVTEGNAKV
jgi:dGTP triphosphohydrolase